MIYYEVQGNSSSQQATNATSSSQQSSNNNNTESSMLEHHHHHHDVYGSSLPTELYRGRALGSSERNEYEQSDEVDSYYLAGLKRARKASLSPVIMRDPIAPGMYTRIRKRSYNNLERYTTIDELLSTGRPQSISELSDKITPKAPLYETLTGGDLQSLEGLPIIQEFILDSNFRITIEGRKVSDVKKFIYYFLCIISCGIVFLLAKWFPKLYTVLKTSQSDLAHSTHIYISNSYGQNTLVKVKKSYFGEVLKDVFGNQKVYENIVIEEVNHEAIDMDFQTEEEPSNVLFSDLEKQSVISKKSQKSIYSHDTLILSHAYLSGKNHFVSIEHEYIKGSQSSFDEQCTSSNEISGRSLSSKPYDSLNYLYYFEYRHFRFIYHPNTVRYFENSQWETFEGLPYSKMTTGLSSSSSQQRRIIFNHNLIDIQKVATLRLFIDEVLHPFNVFQIFSIILWCADHYFIYAAAIAIISIFTITHTIIETKKNMETMRKMSIYTCTVNILRDGKWGTFNSTELVPGDIFELNMQLSEILPCDALLVEGDCIVNESMLTGESTPVSKCAIEEESWNELFVNSSSSTSPISSLPLSQKSLLFCGTKLIRVRNYQDMPARAIVLKSGFNTTKGYLIRNILFPKPIQFKFYSDSIKFILVLSIIALLGFTFTVYNYIVLGVVLSIVFLRALDLVTIVIPPALPLSMSIGTSFTMNKLKSLNIFCTSPARINIAGKLNLFCFDKTGTLTEEGLDIMGIHHIDVSGKHFEQLDPHSERMTLQLLNEVNMSDEEEFIFSNSSLMLFGMACCHSIKNVEGKLIGDPLDIKMFEFTNWVLEDSGLFNGSSIATIIRPPSSLNLLNNRFLNELGIIKSFEFVPSLRRMSSIVKIFQGSGLMAFIKGAPESINEICIPSSLPSNFQTLLAEYTIKGYRVVAIAYKAYPSLNWAKAQKLKREQVESDLNFLGFIVFENRLKPSTKGAIEQLKQAKFRTTIATGDNTLTAISVAKECKIINSNIDVFLPKLIGSDENKDLSNDGEVNILWESIQYPQLSLSPSTLTPLFSTSVNKKHEYEFTIGCTGQILEYLIDHCSLEALNGVLMKCDVFARMSPDQKQRLVECFQRLEYCVGFCGDGANDCGALKAADVGLSLSEAEASVAAPFTCKVQDIRCTLDLIKEGRSALATSFSCFKFMALYSMIQFTSVSLLYVYTSNLSDIQYVFIDLCIIIPIAIMIGRLNSSEKLTKSRPTAKLISKKVLISIIGQICIQILCQLFLFTMIQKQDWYIAPEIDTEETDFENHLVTALFSFSSFQYVLVSFIFSHNVPYQRFMFKDKLLMLTNGAILLVCLLFLLYPPLWVEDLLKLVFIPFNFRIAILVLVILNSCLSVFAELFLFPLITWVLKKKLWVSKKRSKIYKRLLENHPYI